MIAELAHELLPYAAALYVFDSFVRVRQGDSAFLALPAQRLRRRGPGWHLGGLLPTSEVFMVGGDSAAGNDPAGRLAAIRARRAAQSRSRAPLSVASTLLFATVFAALPAVVYRYNEIPFAAEGCILIAAILWTTIIAVAARALRKAGASRAATASALAPALFFAPAAAHVQSFLWRDLYRGWPPLEVAAVLLSPAEFRRCARQELRTIEDALRRAGGTPAEADAASERERLLALLAALEIPRSEIAAADAPRDAQAAVYCPLCETEYRSGFRSCTDCEVPLQPFAASPGPSGSPATR